MNLKESNEYRKVIIENIVFLQGDDYSQFEQDNPDLHPAYDESDCIDYLLQWYFPGEHETGEYYARDINTAFLGNLVKVNGCSGYFLYSYSTRIGYIGLSKIVEFTKGA